MRKLHCSVCNSSTGIVSYTNFEWLNNITAKVNVKCGECGQHSTVTFMLFKDEELYYRADLMQLKIVTKDEKEKLENYLKELTSNLKTKELK